ncbi:MAG: putative metal-binding motif-containing protein [Myxococcota bacterium]
MPLSMIVLGVALGAAGCGNFGTAHAMYGAEFTLDVDADGDGYTDNVDCDDDNADIHPDATEVAGDGIDSNCDGEDDPQA